jgi:hypothetical protein
MVDVNVLPYRVEWRPDLVTGWLLIGASGSRTLADDLAEATLSAHRGYCRLITQHVIESSPTPGSWEGAPRG